MDLCCEWQQQSPRTTEGFVGGICTALPQAAPFTSMQHSPWTAENITAVSKMRASKGARLDLTSHPHFNLRKFNQFLPRSSLAAIVGNQWSLNAEKLATVQCAGREAFLIKDVTFPANLSLPSL